MNIKQRYGSQGFAFCFSCLEIFARFAEYWLDTGIDLPVDLDGDDDVDLGDLDRFIYEWLYCCACTWPLEKQQQFVEWSNQMQNSTLGATTTAKTLIC